MPLKASSIYPSSDPQFVTFPSRRSVVHSTKGIVSSSQPLATQAGIRILREGGNCADAAVATAAALNMTEPGSTGIGGDMFCLFYNAKTKKVHALNGSGRAGANVTLESVRKDLNIPDGEIGHIPKAGDGAVHAVTVPGAAAGWVDTLAKFGSGKLSMSQILAPAIELGEEGYPVSEIMARAWRNGEALIRQASPNFAEMLKKDPNAPDGCRAPRAGEIFKNPTLAKTFRAVAEHGKKGFYEGRIAEEWVKVTSELGGRLTLDDLKHHAELGSEEVDAISLKFTGQGVSSKKHSLKRKSDSLDGKIANGIDGSDQGVEVWEHPPNGQGIVALMALGILQELEKTGKIGKWSEADHNSVEYIHAVVEALRIAFADANWWVTDPNVEKVPSAELISSKYLAERAKLFDPSSASAPLSHGSPAHTSSDTVYFAATDSEGNGISFIISNYKGFGTGIIPRGCGFTLQNRGANFVLQKGHPNVIAPNKRPYHTIIPSMVTNPADGSLHSVYGVMGGFMQPQGHVQVLLNMLVFGCNPQAALDAPRVCIAAETEAQGFKDPDRVVCLEEGISEEVADGLRKLGHEVEYVKGFGRALFGRGQLIRAHVDEVEGRLVWSAGSDMRGDGAAMPV